jgi:hypothetical protein
MKRTFVNNIARQDDFSHSTSPEPNFFVMGQEVWKNTVDLQSKKRKKNRRTSNGYEYMGN